MVFSNTLVGCMCLSNIHMDGGPEYLKFVLLCSAYPCVTCISDAHERPSSIASKSGLDAR